jgi:hypothetical protein
MPPPFPRFEAAAPLIPRPPLSQKISWRLIGNVMAERSTSDAKAIEHLAFCQSTAT